MRYSRRQLAKSMLVSVMACAWLTCSMPVGWSAFARVANVVVVTALVFWGGRSRHAGNDLQAAYDAENTISIDD